MARAGRSWEFLSLATGMGDVDDQTVLLISASFARLGLGTLALEWFVRLPAAIQGSTAGLNLKASIGKLPSDVVGWSRREALVRQNLAALAARGVELGTAFDAWRTGAMADEVYASFDGNVVRRGMIRDAKAAAAGIVAGATEIRGSMSPPIVIDGMDSPWLAMAAFEATLVKPSGYAARVTIVEPDAGAFLDALSMADLSGLWRDPRVEVLVGDNARQGLRESLARRIEEQFQPLMLTMDPRKTGVETRRVVEGAIAEQVVETRRAITATDALYGEGALGHIHARLAEVALAGKGSLRVLITTSRYTTFVKHSASDLASALRRMGHEAEVLMEARDDAQLSTLAYRRAIERVKPDLIVLVNYPRSVMEPAFPAGVPFVCWIQDTMPHLYDAKVGAAQGLLDFVMGYTFENLYSRYGYPLERAMSAPVMADSGKFHEGPVDAALAARHECEVAMVTHHSETPDAMHARLSQETTNDPAIRATMERVRVALALVMERPMEGPTSPKVSAIVERAAHDVMGASVPAKSIEQLVRHYAMPLADRMFRHETLRWAAELCEQRGWRLHLYGKGWETHPTLRKHAKGPLSHDEDLRAAYRGARVHLHAGLCSLVHQRVMECALSGGLCLGRVSYEALAPYHATVRRELVRGTPDCVEADGRVGYLVENHPVLRERLGLHQRLGMPSAQGMLYMSRARYDMCSRMSELPDESVNPTTLFGDLSESTFWSRESFMERVGRAVEDRGWREQMRASMRQRVAERFTYATLAERMIGLVERGVRRAMEGAGS